MSRVDEACGPGNLQCAVLCTGNSARSILAEALIDHWAKGRFKGYSTGSFLKGAVHPFAIEALEELYLPTDGLRSKSWNEFARPGAPVMDFVFTVCDQAAGELCPVWPGNPVTAHWGVPDPAAVYGTEVEQRRAFRDTYVSLENRIKLFVALPIGKLDRLAIQRSGRDRRPRRGCGHNYSQTGAPMTSATEFGGRGAAPVLGTFERYLTLWVALCILASIVLAGYCPGPSSFWAV